MLLAWGLGASHPVLDLLSIPGAALVGLPGFLGLPGLLFVVLFALFSVLATRIHSLASSVVLVAGMVASVSLVASCLALTRPLLLLAVVPFLFEGLKTTSSAAWTWKPNWMPIITVLCWLLCLILPPGGLLFLGEVLEGPLVDLLVSLPPWSRELLSLALLLLAGLGLARRAQVRLRMGVLGAGAALGLELSLGTPLSFLQAVGFGALVGGSTLPLVHGLREPLRVAVPIALLSGLVGVSTGLSDRWSCPAPAGEELRFLAKLEDATEIAMSPGNLPFILLLREHPHRLDRVGVNGVVNESVVLEEGGGRLFSASGVGGNFIRLLDGDDFGRVEWWIASTMERTGVLDLPADCDVLDGSVPKASLSLVVSCEDGRLLRADPQSEDTFEVGDTTGVFRGYGADSLPLRKRDGVLSRLGLEGDLSEPKEALGSFSIGPWSGDVAWTPKGLLVARGPLGMVDVRGEGPLWSLGIGGPQSEGDERLMDSARNRLDWAPVPGWPDELVWNPRRSAVWVTSMTSGEITLVDTEVTWHRRTLHVGPVPSRVAIDLTSGRLFGVNRCGLFEARLSSIFPWESTGDVEEDLPKPTQEGSTK